MNDIQVDRTLLQQAVIIIEELLDDHFRDTGLEDLIGNTALILELSVDDYNKLKTAIYVKVKQ